MATFGDYIRHEREKREWTQTDLGSKIGINTSAICRIENGSQMFSKRKLARLSELFQTDLQIIKDLFFADKFVKEAIENDCSNSIFSVAESTAKYYRNKNVKQGKLEL